MEKQQDAQKGLQPYFAEAPSWQAKARESEAPGLSAKASAKAEAYLST